MDVKFKILGSSSSGNAALLRIPGLNILIDAGLSGKKIEALLNNEGLALEALNAVFLTHEHNDHSAGVRGLSKFSNLPFFANQDTIQAIQPKLQKCPKWKVFETDRPFNFGPLKVHPFSVPHDAYDPVGFFFEWGTGDLFDPLASLAWVTDLGYASSLVKERIRKAKILVIEANHCSEMLKNDSKRPWSLKQRISGRHGHLSNKSTFSILKSIKGRCWEKIFLMHLSKDCNNVEIVQKMFSQLEGHGSKFSTFVVDPSSAETIPI
ncbi:MAG: MBL fold metallo-hydrolase [Opitutae bacterium]|nr:MBL fold metallo-hydrolase [Opitutae bacterium]